MSLSTFKSLCCGIVAPAVWCFRNPFTTLIIVNGTCFMLDLGLTYYRLYQKFVNVFEFIPPLEDRNILVRSIKNSFKFTCALWRYRFMTVGGYFPPNVQYYSSLMEKSIIRKSDLRPLLVPSGDSIEVFRCSSIHSHPRSAEFRSSSNQYLIEAVRKAGFEPYVVSAAKRDSNSDGSRYFYCSKDFGMEYRNDPIKENSAIVFTDVDYYADLPRWLNLWKPICMYTLVPEVLNYNNNEFNFRFVDNTIYYSVAGGGSYKHQLWDYKGDTVTAIDLDGNLLVFDIEQRRVKGDEQHRLIWLLPKAKITDPLWLCVYFDWVDNLLVRKNVVNGRLLTLWEPISDKLSIGENGSNYSVTLSGKLYEAIRTRLRFKDSAPFVSDVERMLKEAKHEDYIKDAPILFRCFDDIVKVRPNVVKTGNFPVSYFAIPSKDASTTEDGKTPGQVVTTPLVSHPALFADKGNNPDRASIEGRIDNVKNVKRFSPKYRKYAIEFVKLLVPKHLVGTGVPLSTGEVRVTQDKINQRSRFENVAPTMSVNAENKIKSFIKTETYNASKAPRNISTMTPEITIQSSAFSLPMANILKQHHWYCPGMTPRKIVEKLDDVMRMELNEDIEEGDYTSMDGSVSPDYSNLLMRPLYMSYFAEEHRAEFLRIYKQIYCNRATTTTGFSYKPRMTVRSGSSITTQSDTVYNAFNVYSALRNMGYDENDSWIRIGALFGDDSVNANHQGLFHKFIEQVVCDLGMVYKSNLRKRNEPVLFLGRYFVDPMTTYDSFADPMRTIGKLHASSNSQVSIEQGAANKAHGYLTTDHATPIIGTWAKRVLEITGLKFKNGTGEEKYKCSNAWPQRDPTVIAEAMSRVVEISLTELKIKDEVIRNVDSLDQFPVIFDTVYNHKMQAVVDGELIGTDLHQSIDKVQNGTHRQSETSNNSLQQTRSENADGTDHIKAGSVNRIKSSSHATQKRRAGAKSLPRGTRKGDKRGSSKSAVSVTPGK